MELKKLPSNSKKLLDEKFRNYQEILRNSSK